MASLVGGASMLAGWGCSGCALPSNASLAASLTDARSTCWCKLMIFERIDTSHRLLAFAYINLFYTTQVLLSRFTFTSYAICDCFSLKLKVLN